MNNELIRISNMILQDSSAQTKNPLDFILYENELLSVTGLGYSGKSTFAKAVCGLISVPCDSYCFNQKKISADGKTPQNFANYINAGSHRLSDFSIYENIYILSQHPAFSLLNTSKMINSVKKLFAKYPFGIDPSRSTSSLSIAEQHRILIGKAVFNHSKVIILDEITRHYTEEEFRQLSELLLQLKSVITVIYISKYPDPILLRSDRVAIMRNQTLVEILHQEELSPEKLQKLSIGNLRNAKIFSRKAPPETEKIFSCTLHTKNGPIRISSCAGEIVSVFVEEEFPEEKEDYLCTMHLTDVTVSGKEVLNYNSAVADGFGIIPHNFAKTGYFHGLSEKDNAAMQLYKKISKFSVIRNKTVNFALRQSSEKYQSHHIENQDL